MDVDAALVAALGRSDADATDELIERYGDRLYTLALRVTGAPQIAVEAMLEALGTAGRALRTLDGESAFSAWIGRVTAKAAYRRLLAQRTAADIALDEVLPAVGADGHFEALDDWSDGVDEREATGHLRELVIDAIGTLPPEYRTALVLHDVEGMSKPDIAEVLGVGPAAVASKVHHARLFLRRRLFDRTTSKEAHERRTAETGGSA